MYAHTDIFFGTKMMYDGIQLLKSIIESTNPNNTILMLTITDVDEFHQY